MTALISRRDGSPRRRRRLQRWLGENPLGMLLSAPYVAFVVVVFLVPFGFGIWMSFHDFFFTAPGVQVPQPFVGLDNFAQVLADPQVHQAFLNLLVFLVINVPLTVVLGLLLSSGLNAVVHWKGFFRVAYYIPYVTASVATIAVWIFLFNGNGVVNTLLGELAPNPTWLANPAIIMPLIAVYVTWKNLGFYILLYLAALQNVPQEQYEAAQLDGAGRWQRFRSVTLPGVAPVTSLVILLSIITTGQIFTEPYLLTGGGPNGASLTPALLMYQKGIQQGQPDIAAAIGMILVLLVMIVSLVSRRLTERKN
ncbi:multiple sugar transport system permease protein [Microbacterium sp. SORGH_AS428]|uniref:carbohydrate ABC transporter permease n=1 Tax=Microbacterium sp. SORGH_AS_0428 TaxID=3041788 RepID=UPI00285629BF|nr:sugar ABC transporter permease [Microbacterium sp. SORGH_AS_0428]MDR6199408.1 multiple sugar transport system permease protein [Microbacterium sp. SORGH_AS_0428]